MCIHVCTVFFLQILIYLYFVKLKLYQEEILFIYTVFYKMLHIFSIRFDETVSADQDVYNDLLKNEMENFKVLYQKVKTFLHGKFFFNKDI